MSAAIGDTSSALAASSAQGAYADLSSGDFIKIMLEELSNQDPFEPQDSAALLEQLSSLRNIESQMSLQTSLEDLVLQNQVAVAGGLIGKVIQGVDANNESAQGQVRSVRVADGQAMLELDTGQQVAMSSVTAILRGQPPQ